MGKFDLTATAPMMACLGLLAAATFSFFGFPYVAAAILLVAK